MDEKPKRRRWYQFRLSTWLVLVVALSVLFAQPLTEFYAHTRLIRGGKAVGWIGFVGPSVRFLTVLFLEILAGTIWWIIAALLRRREKIPTYS